MYKRTALVSVACPRPADIVFYRVVRVCKYVLCAWNGFGSLKSQCTACVWGRRWQEGAWGTCMQQQFGTSPAGGVDIALPPYYQVNAIAAIHHIII